MSDETRGRACEPVPARSAQSNTDLGTLRRRRAAALIVLALAAGLGVYLYPRRSAGPSASVLPLGLGMTELGSDTELDSQLANEVGPHEYFRDILVQGQEGESAQHLIRREIAVIKRDGWEYLGSVGADRYGDMILVRAGTRGAGSYALNRSRQICAYLAPSDADPAFSQLSHGHHRRDLLYVTLERNRVAHMCSLPMDLRTPAIK